MFSSHLGWKVPLPLLAARGVKFRVTSLYDKMAAARFVLSDNMSRLHYHPQRSWGFYVNIPDNILLAAMKLGQANVFTCVCDSVNGGGVPPPRGCLLQGVSAPGGSAPGGSAPRGLVETHLGRLLLRVVCILLECILVSEVCVKNSV